MSGLEVLDPRYDAEPAYWAELRRRAGLRADWSWDVLAALGWMGPMPLLVAVLRDGPTVHGVVSASWVSLPGRRRAFSAPGRRRWIGGLHVRSPASGAVPGWWASEDLPVRDLLGEYLRGMRRDLGPACRGVLLRQLGEDDLAHVPRRPRLVRPTVVNTRQPTAAFGHRDDWLATLARKRRHDMRKTFTLIDGDDTIEVGVGSGADLDPSEVSAVLRHNELKYRGRLSPPLEATASLAAMLRQPDFSVVRYVDRGTGALIGVLTILDHPRWPVIRNWSAVPVELGGRSRLYFHWYGTAVGWAIENGKDGLIVGKGKPDMKRRLGAELVPQYVAALPVW